MTIFSTLVLLCRAKYAYYGGCSSISRSLSIRGEWVLPNDHMGTGGGLFVYLTFNRNCYTEISGSRGTIKREGKGPFIYDVSQVGGCRSPASLNLLPLTVLVCKENAEHISG